MSPTFCISTLLRAGRRSTVRSSSLPTTHHQHQQLRHKHQVRVILTRDLPEGQMRGMYAGEVHNVAAGYARNYLVPKKMAVYATQVNFERCGLIDPDIAAKEEAAQQKLLSEDEDENEDLKAADLLRRYLRNKTVRMIRNVDANVPTMCHPGHVSAANLREKLSKQLKIDLEEHESIRILNEPMMGLEEKDDQELMRLIRDMDRVDVAVEKMGEEGELEEDGGEADESVADEVLAASQSGDEGTKDCDTKIKQLGDYLAKITLAGGYVVPLKFRVERR
mmetsp:Transcript_21353/g.44560  ORF Transcript_21353/g.44560 Transcript_21353/m.44560 type:complete len:278 (+) Transcript_21353:323-1156(+)